MNKNRHNFFPNREEPLPCSDPSAAADAGGGVGEAGLQLIPHTKAHGRAQRHAVDRVGRDFDVDLQLLAQVLRQTVELCAAAGQHHAVAEDIARQLRRGLSST